MIIVAIQFIFLLACLISAIMSLVFGTSMMYPIIFGVFLIESHLFSVMKLLERIEKQTRQSSKNNTTGFRE